MNARTQPETTPASRHGDPRLADYGGQYRPAEGSSTRPTDAKFEWFMEEVQKAVNSTDWSQPF